MCLNTGAVGAANAVEVFTDPLKCTSEQEAQNRLQWMSLQLTPRLSFSEWLLSSLLPDAYIERHLPRQPLQLWTTRFTRLQQLAHQQQQYKTASSYQYHYRKEYEQQQDYLKQMQTVLSRLEALAAVRQALERSNRRLRFPVLATALLTFLDVQGEAEQSFFRIQQQAGEAISHIVQESLETDIRRICGVRSTLKILR